MSFIFFYLLHQFGILTAFQKTLQQALALQWTGLCRLHIVLHFVALWLSLLFTWNMFRGRRPMWPDQTFSPSFKKKRWAHGFCGLVGLKGSGMWSGESRISASGQTRCQVAVKRLSLIVYQRAHTSLWCSFNCIASFVLFLFILLYISTDDLKLFHIRAPV